MSRGVRPLKAALALALLGSLVLPSVALAGEPAPVPATSVSSTDAPVNPGPGTITSGQAAAAAKAAFAVPANLTEFRANYYENAGPIPRKVWSLNWSEPVRPERFRGQENMSFEVDAVTGEVRSMSRYRVLPDGSSAPAINFTREEAQSPAEEVARKLQGKHFSEMRLGPVPLESYLYPGSLSGPVIYNYTWVRVANGIPVANEGFTQGAWVNVDASDGAIVGYGADWMETITYPDPKDAFSSEEALKTWLSELGVELQYQTVSDPLGSSNKQKVALVYAWRFPYYGIALDAFTGKVVDQRGKTPNAAYGEVIKWPDLNPETSPAGPVDRVQALALAARIVGLGADWELTNTSYNDASTDYGPAEPTWNFNWTRTTGEGDQRVVWNASATVGARSGTLLNMYRGGPWRPGDEAKTPTITREQALAKALEFLARYVPAEAGKLRLAPAYEPWISPEPARDYRFEFQRLVDGVPFTASTVSVGVDGLTGDITHYYSNQPQLEGGFPDKAQALSAEAIAEKFAANVGIELTYRPQYEDDATENARKYGPWIDSLAPEAQLIYQLPAFYRGLRMDAASGRVVDTYGRDVKMLLEPPKDVAGHWASRDIQIIASRGLLDVNDQGLFQPERALTRAEAARLVVLAFGRNEIRAAKPRFADVAAGSAYGGFIESAAQAGWLDVTDGIFRPDDPMTREAFAAMLVRALGYSRVAKMSVQIPMSYSDASSVSADLRNAVALAAGLGIFSPSGKFRPQDALTRAEAAVTTLRVSRLR